MSSFSLLRSFSTDTPNQPSSPQAQNQFITPPKNRRMNKRFSFHQKQQQSVKDPLEVTSLMRSDKKSKALTRRWSSLKQYQTTALSQQSLATGSSAVTSSNVSPQNAPSSERGEKKKWEVIEHFTGGINGRETVSSSLLAVS
jgi:hypothetical protein